MDEQEQYDKICKNEFATIKETLECFNHKLFVDNGSESLQSKINRHNNWIRTQATVQKWLLALVLGTIILSILNLTGNWLKNKISPQITTEVKASQ